MCGWPVRVSERVLFGESVSHCWCSWSRRSASCTGVACTSLQLSSSGCRTAQHTHARIIAALASRHSISRPAQPNSTENYGRTCLTPLSPHRNLYTVTNEQYHFMTSFDRFPVPVRSAVKSNFTHWCCQNLSKGALNALTVQASTTELGKLFQTITMRAEKNVFVSHNEKNDFAIYSVAETLDDKKQY